MCPNCTSFEELLTDVRTIVLFRAWKQNFEDMLDLNDGETLHTYMVRLGGNDAYVAYAMQRYIQCLSKPDIST